ncbi:MAG: hypothetical protein EAZ95_15415 [Bacteroidetes bacterium]|jgi:hypothetical protein|nr:MAG: hypothetical protein EAZ95_15415 [Bacteroidota bacterium]
MMISAEFGKIIGWGEGQSDEDVAQTIQVITSLSPELIQKWQAEGLTIEWVQEQLQKYDNALAKGGNKLKNKQLLHRKVLMEKIIALW